jgi:putative addiction module killer protein
MIEVQRTDVFVRWFDGLRDNKAIARISNRIDRLTLGNPGDVKSVGGGVSELRIDHGPGYRLYFTKHGKTVVILLCGGDKSTQAEDIKLAIEMAKELK